VMLLAHAKEGIVERGQVPGQEQGGDARLVGLKPEGYDVAHQANVIADIFRQAVVRTLHRKQWAPRVARLLRGLVPYAFASARCRV
jgi:hypothetical protein